MHVEIDRDRLVATMETQAEIGGVEGERALDRLALTDADRRARDWLVGAMEAAGLDVRIDAVGNVFGRREGRDPDAGTVLLGSHLDSQPRGGIYDGPLGVVAALEFVRALNDADRTTRRPIEVVNWTNEEGSRFQPAMFASGVWAGAHDVETAYETTDADGVRFVDALEGIGYRGDIPAEPTHEYDSYLELHVEQGPYLDDAGADVGVVEGIVGFRWAELSFEGQADHSGTTPMHARQDALVAAADVVTAARRLPGTLGERTVGTCGVIEARPGSINVVPGEVSLTCGFRDPDDEVVARADERIRAEAAAAAEREGVAWSYEPRMRVGSVDFADRAVAAVQAAADAGGHESLRLTSGAGHDATHAAAVCDAAMVFAVSEDGRSHSPDEFTSWADCHAAAGTLADAALRLADADEAPG